MNKDIIIKEANDDLIRLLDIHDNEFGDKNIKKAKMGDIVVVIEGKLDQLTNNNDSSNNNNVHIELTSQIEAEILYIRGRSLDCIDGSLAETYLSKSVKLDPTNFEGISTTTITTITTITTTTTTTTTTTITTITAITTTTITTITTIYYYYYYYYYY